MNDRHLKFFSEFVRYEKLTGGPDPHMAAVVHMCQGLPMRERLWHIALYVGFYNVPSAERTWDKFPDYPGDGPMVTWLSQQWEGLRFRRERKSVGLDSTHGERMVDYLQGYLRTVAEPIGDMSFEDLWKFALKLPHVGRYAATKLCECWRRVGAVTVECTDIRAKGGWSPRTAVNMILSRGEDPRDDYWARVVEAEQRAASIKMHFPELTWYEFEVMLCEYKASFSTKRQYPGRSLDSELSYERAVNGMVSQELSGHERARLVLSPSWALGEVQGWDPAERLKNLGRVVSEYGYTWSDSLYDYNATTDFADPVRKP